MPERPASSRHEPEDLPSILRGGRYRVRGILGTGAQVIALLVARLATFGLFRLVLPIVLGLLAIVFRGGLRRAAERCVEIGREGEEGLRRALAAVQDPAPERQSPEEPRLRVDDPVAKKAEAKQEDDDDDVPSARSATRRHP